MSDISAERSLVRQLVQCSFSNVPAEAITAAKRGVIDSLGVMLAATGTSPDARILIDLAREAGGMPQSTIFGFGDRVPAPMAAFANGALGHALDFDDTHEASICHPTASVLPAALAASEYAGGVSGHEFLVAIASASDIVCRVGLALDESPTHHGWLTAVTCSYFGAVAAAGKILRLSEDQLMSAFGIALGQIGGAQETSRGESAVRGIRDAFSQQVGVMSALLALRGLRGAESFLEGERGFFNQYFRGRYTRARLLDQLGTRFEGVGVSYKPWPCCRISHTYVGALLELMREHRLAPSDISEVRAVVNDFSRGICEPLAQRRQPTTPIFARDSLPFILGLVIARQSIELDDFEPHRLADPVVLQHAAKVSYVQDQALSGSDFGEGIVEVTTLSGQRLRGVEAFAFGSPQNPMNDEALLKKFRDCCRYSIRPMAAPAADRLGLKLLHLEEAGSVDFIFRMEDSD